MVLEEWDDMVGDNWETPGNIFNYLTNNKRCYLFKYK